MDKKKKIGPVMNVYRYYRSVVYHGPCTTFTVSVSTKLYYLVSNSFYQFLVSYFGKSLCLWMG